MRTLLSVAVLVVVLVAACGDDTTTTSTGEPVADALAGRAFVAQRVTGRELVAGTELRLNFDEGGTFGAHAGCNSMGGPFEVVDGTFVVPVEGISMTEMGCDEARAAQDAWLADFLVADPSIALDGDELTLTGPTTAIVLLDREVADPDRLLTGTVWVLDGIITGDAVSTVPGDTRASVTFADESTFEAELGCNSGGGSVEVSTTDGELRFGTSAFTDTACSGPAGEVEAHLRELIGQGELTFEIVATRLTIQGEDVGASFLAEE